MTAFDMIVTEKDHTSFMTILDDLARESNAKFVFLLDKAGQQIASAGNLDDVDATSLASLTAGNVAATEGVAQLVGEPEFMTLYHEGRKEHLHINVIGKKVILLVVFDERSSLGLVRLRVEQCTPRLNEAIRDMLARTESGNVPAPEAGELAEITAEDVEALFN
jgi:predicted regulator of Ras-like GTPase activity (Roadblock/LC7/MglB family)